MTNKKRNSKYNAKKVTVDGINFDSKAESEYYLYLKKLRDAGEIIDFQLQPKYNLQPAFTNTEGKKVRAINYKADFIVHHNDFTREVIDIKGVETPEFKLKKKLFEHKYDCSLTLLCKAPKYLYPVEWVKLEDLKEIRKQRKQEGK